MGESRLEQSQALQCTFLFKHNHRQKYNVIRCASWAWPQQTEIILACGQRQATHAVQHNSRCQSEPYQNRAPQTGKPSCQTSMAHSSVPNIARHTEDRTTLTTWQHSYACSLTKHCTYPRSMLPYSCSSPSCPQAPVPLNWQHHTCCWGRNNHAPPAAQQHCLLAFLSHPSMNSIAPRLARQQFSSKQGHTRTQKNTGKDTRVLAPEHAQPQHSWGYRMQEANRRPDCNGCNLF